MTLHHWNGVTVLDLGEMDIWDGADLSLLRDTLTEVIQDDGCRAVGVNLRWVKYIPSGFFGMISDWHDKGVRMFVYEPQENVAKMLWFRKFFDEIEPGVFLLLQEQKVLESELLEQEEEVLELSEENLVFQAHSEWGEL